MIKILPYLLLSILLNAIVNRFFSSKKIQFSSRNEYLAIVSAACIGLVSPLPTYAAIPIGLSFLSAGIPFSAIMAFIISSPLMNPTVFFLTVTQISLEMAIARSLAAFVLALVGGLLMIKLSPIFYQSDYQPGSDQAKQTRTFSSELLHSAIYMGKYFSITLLLSAVVRALVPPEMVTRLLGGDTKTGTLLAIGMGIPFYTCGGSAIPFMQSLMELGMNKGATLAFFLAGPATKLETLYAYKRMLGGKVLAFFLLLTMLFSYIAGLIYAWL